ncbi:MAG: dicarboxylate/amino acid:cation symporter [Spirochaetales bacterium]|nr:dicarboxylate/amino acid:cation symporter [Spirochaetales bacterium]
MKLSLRLTIATGIGLVLGILLPLGGGDTLALFDVLERIIVSIGRYVVFPLVFFSVAIGVYELWYENKLHTLGLSILALIPGAALLGSFVGTLGFAIFRPERIPIIIKEGEVLQLPDALDLIERIFPSNVFEIFVRDSGYLLPVLVAGILLGLAFHFPKGHAGPSLELFDSLSRILFRVAHYIIEFMALGFIVLGAYRMLQLRETTDLDLFQSLFFLIFGLVGFMTFVLYPLILFSLGGKKNPFSWLRGTFLPLLASVLSGDTYFVLPFLSRLGKEHHKIPRKVGVMAYPLSILFGRSGSAMVIGVSFLAILQSYSSLELTLGQYLWVFAGSFGVSFLLVGVPSSGALIGLALLSGWYGQGLEEGYLILLPAAPFLIGAGVFLDVLTASVVGILAARWNKLEMKHIS